MKINRGKVVIAALAMAVLAVLANGHSQFFAQLVMCLAVLYFITENEM